MKAAVWLRRDFRTDDHPALSQATRTADEVVTFFVLDPRTLEEFAPGHKPHASFFGALVELRDAFRKRGKELQLLEGDPTRVVPEFCRQQKIDALYLAKDYEPAARARDAKVESACQAQGARVHALKDHVLFEESELLNGSGEPYRVFTAYRNLSFARLKKEPVELAPPIRWKAMVDQAPNDHGWAAIEKMVEKGRAEITTGKLEPGEKAARRRLSSFVDGALARYGSMRDFPAAAGTSRLSQDLRNGSLSPRTVFQATKGEAFLSELAWRDFFHMIGFHFPAVFEENFNRKFEAIRWRNDEREFEAWCQGRTGYPIVDAGMRELVSTGFMHNRVRMITAMFLCKHLLVDWRWGERFFRSHLIDGDLAVNNGNWQWCASTGVDAQPYFRIFNPLAQQKRFDPKGEYIHHWLPELGTDAYPEPIVDHAMARMRALTAFKKAC